MEDDRLLWSRTLAGDSTAYGLLYRRHYQPVYNFLFRRTASWDRAEDLTSVVFLEAWRRRHEVAVTTLELLPWLLGIAHNVARNEWRARRRHRGALQRFHAQVSRHAPDPDVAARLDDEERMRRILKLIQRLPEHERAVLELVGWLDLSYEQAAAALDDPIGTVRSRLSRARARLARVAAAKDDVVHDKSVYPTTQPSAKESHP